MVIHAEIQIRNQNQTQCRFYEQCDTNIWINLKTLFNQNYEADNEISSKKWQIELAVVTISNAVIDWLLSTSKWKRQSERRRKKCVIKRSHYLRHTREFASPITGVARARAYTPHVGPSVFGYLKTPLTTSARIHFMFHIIVYRQYFPHR